MDVDAAVRVASSENEFAVVRVVEEGDRVRVYEMVSVRDEPGTLRVEWGGDAEAMATVKEAALECRLTRFGDAGRERAFVESVRAWKASHAR